MKGRDWLHRILDGDVDQPRPSPDSPEAERLAAYEEILDDLAALEMDVPPELEARAGRVGGAQNRRPRVARLIEPPSVAPIRVPTNPLLEI